MMQLEMEYQIYCIRAAKCTNVRSWLQSQRQSATDPQEDGHQRRENADHRVVTEWIDRQNWEMSQHTRRDVVSTATGRTHRRHELRVDEEYFARVLQVVPVTMIEVLTQQFYRRLSAVYLSCRHVHVVDENDRLLVRWRPEVTLLSTIHLGHYQKLHARNIKIQHPNYMRQRLKAHWRSDGISSSRKRLTNVHR